jgi:L-alanine-DL-glutamate epimerase-like enolase superfamily enzyme
MRVTGLEAIPVAYPEPNDADAIRHLCLVRIETDVGAVGWGEAVTMWPQASRATAELVGGFAELVIGTDPDDVEGTWRRMREHAWWYGGAGIASFAVSAIDIALWDLRGQALGRPLVELLGGPCRDRLPAVASGHAAIGDLEGLIAETASWVDGKAQGVKVGFGKRGNANLGFDRDRDVAFVAGLRAAVGEEPMLMVDLGVRNRWSVAEAVDRITAFEAHRLEWIEEPLGADNPSGYAELRSNTETRIAYGEREWNVRGLERVIESGTCDVVGIDPGRAEGITGFLEACRLCERQGVQANAHSWSSAIVLAASLAISWSQRACALLETKPLRNPMQHDLAEYVPEPAGGWWPLPERPGLGIEVDPGVVDSFRLDRADRGGE